MKKLYLIILVVVFSFSLASCNKKKPEKETTPTPTYVTPTPVVTPTPTPVVTPTPTPVVTPTPTPTPEVVDIKPTYEVEYYPNYYKEADGSGNYYFGYQSTFDFSTYYASISNVTDVTTLRSNLHTILTTNIKKYSYAEAWEQLRIVDEDPNNANNILCILTGKSMTKDSNGSNGTEYWNREHIWSKSFGFPESFTIDGNKTSLAGEWYAFTDVNHLMAAEAYTNSTYHNNRYYDEVETPLGMGVDAYGNSYDTLAYEPRDEVKGDIARMLLYMDVRYEGDATYDNGLDLVLTNDKTLIKTTRDMYASGDQSKVGYYGILDTLIQWCIDDPVDDLERRRNDLAYSVQGNRNPFIDMPELINILYNGSYESSDTDNHYVYYLADNAEYAYYDYTLYETGSKLSAPEVNPVNKNRRYQFTGWYTDKERTNKFDFSENTMPNKDLYLYAGYEVVDLSPTVEFSLLKVDTFLDLDYTCTKLDEPIKLIETSTVTPNSSSSGSITVSTNTTYRFDQYLDYDTTLFEVSINTHSKNSFYINTTKGIILYNGAGDGTELVIRVKDGEAAVITKVEVKYDMESPDSAGCTGEVTQVLSSDGKKFSIQNKIINNTLTKSGPPTTSYNKVDIKSITISYYTEIITEEYTFNHVSLRNYMYVPTWLRDELGSTVKYYVVVNNDKIEVELSKEGYLTYSIDITDLDTLYEVYFICEVGEDFTETMMTEYSARSLANYMITNMRQTNDVVKDNLAAYKTLIA